VRYRDGWGYERRLKRTIEIPAGPDSRPGERLRAPSVSIHPPWPLGPDGSRSDFRFLISRRGSNFGGVCLGPVSERGEPLEAAHRDSEQFAQRGWEAAGLEPEIVAGESAWRKRLTFPRSVLVDWFFAHNGWLFAAGVLCRAGDREAAMVERAQAVLATWEWIEAGDQSG
jgi:hypothetical protein